MSDNSLSKTLTPEQISTITRETNYGTWRFQKGWKPMYIADAEGCWFIDGAGRRYLDFSAQLMCVNLGHKNARVIEAITQQANELAYVTPGYATRARARLSEKLLEVLPQGLNKFFFATSGTEANEAAFKIARMVTGKNKIISRYRSYHGSTMGAIAATGDPRRWAMEPAGKGGGVVFAPEVNCYDCPIKHTYPSCNVACADYIEHMIRNESDVRGLGLFFAVEIVKNRKTKQLFNTMRDKVEGKPLVVDQIVGKMMAQGVSIQAWVSHFVIAPPLIITKEELDLGIAALDENLSISDALVEA